MKTFKNKNYFSLLRKNSSLINHLAHPVKLNKMNRSNYSVIKNQILENCKKLYLSYQHHRNIITHSYW